MKFSIILSTLFVSIVCISCKTEVPKALESKSNLVPDYQLNMVNGVKPVKLKTGKIVCPVEAEIKFVGNSQTSVYCYTMAILFTPKKGTTVDVNNLNKVLICDGKVNLTSKNTGYCNENIEPIDFK